MANELLGVNDLLAQLRELKAGMIGPDLRAAVRAGIQPALAEARARIPVGAIPHTIYKGRLVYPGFAQRNIAIKTVLSRDGQMAAALLGVRREAFYASIFVELELGHSKNAGHPWLRPAFYDTQSAQVSAVADRLRKRLLLATRKRAAA